MHFIGFRPSMDKILSFNAFKLQWELCLIYLRFRDSLFVLSDVCNFAEKLVNAPLLPCQARSVASHFRATFMEFVRCNPVVCICHRIVSVRSKQSVRIHNLE